MTTKTEDGGTAFPNFDRSLQNYVNGVHGGMSLRDYFAAATPRHYSIGGKEVRIIERAEPEFEYSCPHCKSKLGITKDDLRGFNKADYSGQTDYYIYAMCAVCNSEFQVNESKVPCAWRPSPNET